MWLEDALACTNVLLVVEERPAGHAHLFMTAKAKHLEVEGWQTMLCQESVQPDFFWRSCLSCER